VRRRVVFVSTDKNLQLTTRLQIFFLFADSNDDKDTILEGLAIAMQ
jgi:hypothetical protein